MFESFFVLRHKTAVLSSSELMEEHFELDLGIYRTIDMLGGVSCLNASTLRGEHNTLRTGRLRRQFTHEIEEHRCNVTAMSLLAEHILAGVTGRAAPDGNFVKRRSNSGRVLGLSSRAELPMTLWTSKTVV